MFKYKMKEKIHRRPGYIAYNSLASAEVGDVLELSATVSLFGSF